MQGEVPQFVIAAGPEASLRARVQVVHMRGGGGVVRPANAVEFDDAFLVAEEHVTLGSEGHAEDLRMADIVGRPEIFQHRPAGFGMKPAARIF